MRKPFLFLLLSCIFLFSFALAQEPPSYNLGSAMGAKELTAAPGSEAITLLYFYNVFGNRTTHVSLNVGKAPKDWEIEFSPELRSTTYDVSGVLTQVQENLSLEPAVIVAEVPKETAGFAYLPAPNIGGFIPAREVKIKIKIPKNEQLGKEFIVQVDATAEWLGQTGNVAFKQNRSFEYKITTISKEFYEKPVPTEELAAKPSAESPLTAFLSLATAPIWIILIIAIVLLAFYLGRKTKSKQ